MILKCRVMTTDEILTTNWETLVGQEEIQTCLDCGVPLQESISGIHRFDGNLVCSDCYFGQGAERILREYPIESPQ